MASAPKFEGTDEIAAFVAVDLPDPRRLAGVLTIYYPTVARALIAARRKADGYWIDDFAALKELRAMGLVEIAGNYLGAYGTFVRRALIKREGMNDDAPDGL